MNLVDELALKLRRRCEAPGLGGKVVEIHLFGIEFADDLMTVPISSVISRAGLQESYKTELRKGINLAPYVSMRS